jgi:hypothetical protein
MRTSPVKRTSYNNWMMKNRFGKNRASRPSDGADTDGDEIRGKLTSALPSAWPCAGGIAPRSHLLASTVAAKIAGAKTDSPSPLRAKEEGRKSFPPREVQSVCKCVCAQVVYICYIWKLLCYYR